MAAASFSSSFNTLSSSITPDCSLRTNAFPAAATPYHRSKMPYPTTMRTSSSRPIKAFTTTATGTPDTEYNTSSTSGRFSTLAPRTASLYEVLGVQSNASYQEIKKAYRTLARELHPDVVGGGSRNKDSDFIRVHEAYSTLSDPEKRSDYDRAMFIRRSLMNQRSSSFVESRMSTVGSGFPRRMSRTWETDQCW